MYPRRKTVESSFIFFQVVVKLFLILKIKMFFFRIDCLNKMAIGIIWRSSQNLYFLINILERPIQWKVFIIFAKNTLKL